MKSYILFSGDEELPKRQSECVHPRCFQSELVDKRMGEDLRKLLISWSLTSKPPSIGYDQMWGLVTYFQNFTLNKGEGKTTEISIHTQSNALLFESILFRVS
jgi:hypothetical protein